MILVCPLQLRIFHDSVKRDLIELLTPKRERDFRYYEDPSSSPDVLNKVEDIIDEDICNARPIGRVDISVTSPT